MGPDRAPATEEGPAHAGLFFISLRTDGAAPRPEADRLDLGLTTLYSRAVTQIGYGRRRQGDIYLDRKSVV